MLKATTIYIVSVIFYFANTLSSYNILISIYHCTKKELTCFLFEQDRELWKQKKYFQRGGLMDYFCHLQFYKHFESLKYPNSHLSLHKEGIEMFVWKQKTFAFIIVQTLRVIRIF